MSFSGMYPNEVLWLEIAGRLKFPYICLSIFLLVLPLVCSAYEENNGKNDMEELLQNLLKAEKERRQLLDDKNAKGSRGTEQGLSNDDGNVPDIKTEELPNGVVENEVTMNNELTQKIIQDCGNKYELIMDKDFDESVGSCFLHKMNDIIYQKDCERIDTEEKITINYQIGNEIVNRTLLSSIKGINVCNGKPVLELNEISVTRRDLDEYEKMLDERKVCNKCKVYNTYCKTVCAKKSGWWHKKCKREYQCECKCKYDCS